jgi:hypothetical protein
MHRHSLLQHGNGGFRKTPYEHNRKLREFVVPS